MQTQKQKTNYSSNLTDKQWNIIAPLIPESKSKDNKKGGRPRIVNIREIINAIFYVTRTGCQWELLPNNFPKAKTVYWYFNKWKADGTWKMIHDKIRDKLRVSIGKKRTANSWNS